MKKRLCKMLLVCFSALSICFFSCKDDSDGGGSGIDYNATGSSEAQKVSSGVTIKNKVVNINNSTVYYEYLVFDSETKGTYKLIKLNGEIEETVIESPVDGSTLADSFTYDSASGKITLGSSSAYMLNVAKGGTNIKAIAKEILSTDSENKTSLFNTWKTSSGKKITLKDGGIAEFSGEPFWYTNNSGWILISNDVPLFWTKINNQNTLFYLVYETERTESRSVMNGSTFSLVTEDFLFAY